MKKALVIRYGAFGDVIHISHIPRLLKQVKGFDVVDVHTNPKGIQILAENPYIDSLTVLDVTSQEFRDRPTSWLNRHWAIIGSNYDEVFNFQDSIEHGYIAMEHDNIYYQSSKVRREKFGEMNYYDIGTNIIGLKEFFGTTGEMYFKVSEHTAIEEYVANFKDRFKVLLNLSGSSLQKRLIDDKEIAKRISEKYPEALIMTTGDADCKVFDFKINDSKSFVGKYGIRQMILLTKHVDLTIGCESGLLVASNMWNKPTIQLLTTSNFNNHPKYAKNDLSLQSPAYCSPCHKGPYRFLGCPIRDGYPICVRFDIDKIMEKVEVAHDVYVASRNADNNVSSLSAM